MYSEVDIARIETCLEHINHVESYTQNILVPEDFLRSNNHIVMDASMMRLQALGELLKKVSSHNPGFELELDYGHLKNVIRFRDFVSHHYDKVGHVDILHLIRVHLPELKGKIEVFLQKNKNNNPG